jgi:GH25 family lysozyme M1 (1,4-beta-N-acetylmuramidase)
MSDVRTIDVSRWQGWIDWDAVRDSGCAGAWIKCGGADGGLYPDSQWTNNRANAATAGLPFGAYFFASPAVGDGPRQAQYAVGLGMGAADQELVAVLDIEHNPYGLSPGQLDDFGEAFCVEVERLTGRRPCAVYSGAYFGVGHNPGHPIGHRPFWVANYGNNTPSFQPPDFQPAVPAAWADTGWAAWQYNSTTIQPGITDNTCDQNTVKSAAWDAMQSDGGDSQEDDDMANRGMVRTKPGSQWAAARLGTPINHEAYWLTLEGSGKARHLWNWDLVQQEAFWQGIDPAQSLLVDDAFMEQRYHHETENLSGSATATTATTISVAVFALALIGLLWLGLFLGDRAGWYDIDRAQGATLIGLVVIVAALIAAFIRAALPDFLRRLGAPPPVDHGGPGE